MKKIKNSGLLIVSLIFGMTLYMPTAFVRAENSRQNADENKVNVSENQNKNDLEKDQEDSQGNDQEEVNSQQEDSQDPQAEVKDEQDDEDQFDGEEIGNEMENSAQSLLDLADKEQGEISDHLKEIANEQKDSKDNIAKEINEIKNRSGFKTFLIGADYKNIGQLRSEMVKVSNQIDRLNELFGQTTNADSKTVLQGQIKILEQQQQKIGDLLKTNESKFSLFGWFMKMFAE